MLEKLSANEMAFGSLTPQAAVAQVPRLQAPVANVTSVDPITVVANLKSECSRCVNTVLRIKGRVSMQERSLTSGGIPENRCLPWIYSTLTRVISLVF